MVYTEHSLTVVFYIGMLVTWARFQPVSVGGGTDVISLLVVSRTNQPTTGGEDVQVTIQLPVEAALATKSVGGSE